MTTTLKLSTQPYGSGPTWNRVYQVPVGRTAIVKSAIAANDNSSGNSTALLGVRSGAVVTPLTGNINVTPSSSANILAGTLSLESEDELVCRGVTGARFRVTVDTIGGTQRCIAESSGTLIAATSTGLYRSTDGAAWVQTQASAFPSATLIAKIGSSWFAYTSATAAQRSTDDGLTWSSQVVTNAPVLNAVKVNGGIIKNGSTFAGLTNVGAAMTTTTDGITWTVQTAFPQTVTGLVHTGINYVAIRNSTDNSVYYSTSGASWTTVAATGVTTFGNQIIATNGSGTVIAAGTGMSISVDHGVSWSTLVTGGPTAIASLMYSGSVFLAQNSTTAFQVSTTGLPYTWGSASQDAGLTVIYYVVFNGSVMVFEGGIRVSSGLVLPATAGLAVTASIMEVF